MKNKRLLNTKTIVMMALIAVLIAAAMAGCSGAVGTGENQGGGSEGAEASHSESGSEGGSEESGNALTLDQTYDTVRNGARLTMAYDAQNNSFAGTVENTTNSTLPQVRVEVHLSNGVELGPTTPVDLAPGEKVAVILPATAQAFDGWAPHAEVGPGAGGEGGEHGSGSEGDGEHGSGGEGGGEHGSGD